MKTLQRLAVILMIAFMISPNAMAGEPTSIAVVDMQKLMTESEAAKDIQKQVKAYQDKFLGELRKKEEALREKEKDVLSQRNTLSQDEFAKKRNEFEGQLIEARQFAQDRKRALDEASAIALTKLKNQILTIVQGIADEGEYDLILARQQVVLGAKSIDVSEEAMKGLNDSIKKVEVVIKEDKDKK